MSSLTKKQQTFESILTSDTIARVTKKKKLIHYVTEVTTVE